MKSTGWRPVEAEKDSQQHHLSIDIQQQEQQQQQWMYKSICGGRI